MFTLDPTLAADTRELTRWPLCRVLLMDDARYPWLILVPARPGLREVHDLDTAGRGRLMEEVARAARALETATTPDKINIGALGNLVEQLHVHVIARRRDDDAWPGPVWGRHPPRPYGEDAARDLAARLAPLLA